MVYRQEHEYNTLNYINKKSKKVALVTGGGRRIGAAIVRRLHQAGFIVAIHCNHSTKEAYSLAADLNDQYPESAYVLEKNLGVDPSSEETLIECLIHRLKRLDLLVNNASVFFPTDCRVFNETQWDNAFNINVKVPFLLSLAAYPYLSQTQGNIINITDIHGEKPLLHYTVYCQTKAALAMQTKALAREFAPKVRVNGVAPGAILWPEHENTLVLAEQKKIIAKTPLKRHGDPLFIANAVLAFAENPFITGQILNVDGGRSLN